MNWFKPKCSTDEKVLLLHEVYSGFDFVMRVADSVETPEQLEVATELANIYQMYIFNKLNRYRKSSIKNIGESFRVCLEDIMDAFNTIFQYINPPELERNYPKISVVRGFQTNSLNS